MKPVDTIIVESRTVGCNGGDGPLGHPLVYLKIGDEGDIVCPTVHATSCSPEGAEEAAGH